MAAFQSVNTVLTPGPFLKQEEVPSATTQHNAGPSSAGPSTSRLDDAKTPTKASFAALPSHNDSKGGEPSSAAGTSEFKKAAKRESAQFSTKSRDSAEDVDMDDSDGDDDGSDDEDSIAADGTRSTKKKKSQRFFCTDYPPCNLSFTRSEHLARHIRKHTGERPFMCHCSRRFSRLDNLRQHAQTVHVNEEIPGDSLAASSTRFQRQIRSDRVRPPGNRSRASTSSSQQPRGHTRNSLSASSIGSIYAGREDPRRRPAPLIMAGDPRSRFSFDSYTSAEGQYVSSGGPGNSGYNTPTSSRYSGGYDSAQWSSAVGSPVHGHSRTASMYADRRMAARRLSVPSSESPFGPQGFGPPSSFGPPTLAPLGSGTQESFSPSGSILASPTSPITPSWSRRESLASAAADDFRRRTWHHPELQQGFTSRLQSVMSSNRPAPAPPPSAPHTNAPPSNGSITLPGIESFLSRPVTPPRRNPSPMEVDTPTRHDSVWPDERHAGATVQWESSLPRNFTRLEIAQQTSRPDDASAWATDATRAVHERAAQQSQMSPRPQPRVSFSATTYSPHDPPSRHQNHHISAPPLTPRDSKRQGWYAGPLPPRQRPSPEGGSSSSDNGIPGTPRMTGHGDYGPVIVQQPGGGWDERDREGQRAAAEQGAQMQQDQGREGGSRPDQGQRQGEEFNGRIPAAIEQAYATYGAVTLPPPAEAVKADDGMLRLEALVAVATGERENTAAAAY
ncbi:hypothetical protein V496_08696 [Pseudogymnoascus sp. VKM F-4515 (FW-2607)]|nr:hypothetical protein V496_08696 [Pseudogymnoascus sp. VKM F-4515 (FW-2607)]